MPRRASSEIQSGKTDIALGRHSHKGNVIYFSNPIFPSWLPAAIKQTAGDLLNIDRSVEGFNFLLLLTSEPMQVVWNRLYKQPCLITPSSRAAEMRARAKKLCKRANSASKLEANKLVEHAVLLEEKEDGLLDFRWDEHDQAAQTFLYRAYKAAVDAKPIYLTDLKTRSEKIRKAANILRKQAEILPALGVEKVSKGLKEIAEECDFQADILNLSRNPKRRHPGTFIRHGDADQIRAFVAAISIVMDTLFGKKMLSTIATVTKIVFGLDIPNKDMRVKVWDILRPPRRVKAQK
jgi:hypothetical protein